MFSIVLRIARHLAPRARHLDPRARHLDPRARHLDPRARHLAPRARYLAPMHSLSGTHTRDRERVWEKTPFSERVLRWAARAPENTNTPKPRFGK